MRDATSLLRGYAVRCNIVAIQYSTVQQNFKSHSTYVDVAQLARSDCNPGCWFEHTVHHSFSSNNVRLLEYTSLQVKTHSMYDWSVMNQIEYTGFRQDSYL